MPLIILFIIGAILLPIITAKSAKKPAPPAPHVNEPGRVTLSELSQGQQTNAPARPQQASQQRPQTAAKTQTVYQYVRDAVEQAAAAENAERRARQEELKRRLEENARRRAQEQAMGMQRKPLAKPEKPVVDRNEDHCGGGSIHDGYHEGVSVFPAKDAKDPVAVAGKLGKQLAAEDDAVTVQQAASENARRAMKRIQKLPPMAQGIIYSEMLGRPKSELG